MDKISLSSISYCPPDALGPGHASWYIPETSLLPQGKDRTCPLFSDQLQVAGQAHISLRLQHTMASSNLLKAIKCLKLRDNSVKSRSSVVAAVKLFSTSTSKQGCQVTFLSGSNKEITVTDLRLRFPKTFFLSSFPQFIKK